MKKKSPNRIKALDFARALSVLLVFLTFVPEGPLYALYVKHAIWNGYHLIDFAFPSFVTLSGTAMAIAYSKKVPWLRLVRRFLLLILIGLLFNLLVTWNFSFSTLRFTGVLQVLAVTGLLTVIITRVSGRWIWPFSAGIVILAVYLILLIYTSRDIPGGLPIPGNNLSGMLDPLIFTNNHIYAQGRMGYDPEGVCTLFSAMASSLFGFTAGVFLKRDSIQWGFLKILALGVFLLALTVVLAHFIPINKRLWTPSFVTLTSGCSIMVLAISHLLWDTRIPVIDKISAPFYYPFDSIGRNAILIYFGSSMLYSVVRHVNVTIHSQSVTLFQIIYDWVNSWSTNPQLAFICLYTGFWVVIAMFLHWRKLYLTI
ncbi:heparan-alpha-glucosaminide N-acetyltransferase domain-containing protein [Dehalobacter sp. DCM]|uniref:heparan-alpha-glucosaminide N-acetyltransferase domain-containing protein n=1 Tax=Dehalobacter sp. DCM TaxID=2907827 RepID=UPI0030812A25|nr:heparan-alpha-glucosaminide N-acetyltransferase domain-containing protein [Dehalobacter sp. DCM]